MTLKTSLFLTLAVCIFCGGPMRAQSDAGIDSNVVIVDPIPVDPVLFTFPPIRFWNDSTTNTTTTVTGLSEGVIFGSYVDKNSMTAGFAFDGTNYTTIDHPEASGFTEVRGYSAGIYAGNFTDANGLTHGFLYDGTNYTTVDEPSANGYTFITGYSGGAYVGNYYDSNYVSQGFVYDGANYTTFTNPNSADGSAYINGFSDGVIYGSYNDTNYVTHGFIYDGTSYTTIDYPGSPWFTEVTGNSAGVVAGNYTDTNGATHGFLYDGTNYTSVDEPSANCYTSITGLSAGSYVGNYSDANGSSHGFLYDGTNYTTVDDPSEGQISFYYPSNTTMFNRGGAIGSVQGLKKQAIHIKVKTSKHSRYAYPTLRLVATSRAGQVTFTTGDNASISPATSYWPPHHHFCVTTAVVTVYKSGPLVIGASQAGNDKFSPASPVTVKVRIKKLH